MTSEDESMGVVTSRQCRTILRVCGGYEIVKCMLDVAVATAKE